ncbi:hypothetical protein [Micromonospora sp. RL09-050-HVF-A]|uniref:hypothetical protein n=1 Tax=Micromonospora sp. RL09-050-HVF-A TaxID=1703433 RepID=UPI001C5D893B|nr:hypothetical protein [Micromonospora sp. RL09-050-HVF-A]MBW4702423.1 hypothetical protein [Micromonospora sp. RL09-050-HVF-A]
MKRRLLQFAEDVRSGRYLDLYVTTAVSMFFAAWLLIGADLDDDIRWSILLAAIGIIMLRSIASTRPQLQARVLLDRSAYEERPIGRVFESAREVSIFAPIGSNLLTVERCESLKNGPLSRRGGVVRVILLAPLKSDDKRAMQLDGLLERSIQSAHTALAETYDRLRRMSEWDMEGKLLVKMISFNPGFSLVAIDPTASEGFINVEFHGYRSDSLSSRMHVRLDSNDQKWFRYWLRQFEAMWSDASDG